MYKASTAQPLSIFPVSALTSPHTKWLWRQKCTRLSPPPHLKSYCLLCLVPLLLPHHPLRLISNAELFWKTSLAVLNVSEVRAPKIPLRDLVISCVILQCDDLISFLYLPLDYEQGLLFFSPLAIPWASLVAWMVKNPPAMQESPVQFPSQEDPLEKG